MAKGSFSYREFYDVPRVLVLHHRGLQLLLDCRFDEGRDEYSPNYLVYVLPAEVNVDATKSWDRLFEIATRFVGEIPVEQLVFDTTKRSSVDTDPIDRLLATE
jgi:hypothetical protein